MIWITLNQVFSRLNFIQITSICIEKYKKLYLQSNDQILLAAFGILEILDIR
jgi:hypothetical protein